MRKPAAIFMILLLVSGCAFVKGDLLHQTNSPAPSGIKKGLEYQLEWLVISPQTGFGHSAGGSEYGALVRNWVDDEFNKSGLFNHIVDIPIGGTFGNSDLILQIKDVMKIQEGKHNWLVPLTLGIFPFHTKYTSTMTVTVRRGGAETLITDRSFTIEEEFDIYGEIFLIVYDIFYQIPFGESPLEIAQETQRKMLRHLLYQLREYGYI